MLDDDIKPSQKRSDVAKARITELKAARDAGYAALKREHARTVDICAQLEKIAKIKFDTITNQDNLPLPPTSSSETRKE